jgi:hypothetical protein
MSFKIYNLTGSQILINYITKVQPVTRKTRKEFPAMSTTLVVEILVNCS